MPVKLLSEAKKGDIVQLDVGTPWPNSPAKECGEVYWR